MFKQIIIDNNRITYYKKIDDKKNPAWLGILEPINRRILGKKILCKLNDNDIGSDFSIW